MERRHLALPAVVLGPVVALALVVGLGVPADEGPIAFAVGTGQLLLGLVGIGVFAVGVHGYRTGHVRPDPTT